LTHFEEKVSLALGIAIAPIGWLVYVFFTFTF
jgi:hypothetical protein